MKLINNFQFLPEAKINDDFGKKNFQQLSIGELIEHQKNINSHIGLYFFTKDEKNFCLLLSNDKNLARKLSISPSPDVYTQDLFPVNYNEISLSDVLCQDKDDVTFINNENGNHYFMIAKGVDAINTLTFIDLYKKKSYAMQKSWARRKNSI